MLERMRFFPLEFIVRNGQRSLNRQVSHRRASLTALPSAPQWNGLAPAHYQGEDQSALAFSAFLHEPQRIDNQMSSLPFRTLTRHWLRQSSFPSLSRSVVTRSSSRSRFYTTQPPPRPKVPTPPGHGEPSKTRPTRPIAATVETSQHAHEHIDGSTAFQPQPFNVPGSPIFGGNSLRDAALTTVVGLLMGRLHPTTMLSTY
jgi:hypothetical protein